MDQLRNSIILLFPWSQVEKEATDARDTEGNARGGVGARGVEGIAMWAADAGVVERNKIGVESGRGPREGSTETRQETNLNKVGGQHIHKSLALMEVSALLHNLSMFLNWI